MRVEELFSLDGRFSAVTGGAGPLGRVLCDTLASLGSAVAVIDRDADACWRLAKQLADDYSVHAVAVPADLIQPNALDEVTRALARVAPVDVLVNNAALTGTAGASGYAVPFEDQTDEAFTLASTLNLAAPFGLVRRLTGQLSRHGHGSVINVLSIYGLVGPNMGLYDGTSMGNPAAYAASKGGLAQLTRYLSTVLAPTVRVNAFAPGGIARGQDGAFVDRYERLTPLARMATEEDFRGVLAWLASDASAYVTGQVVAVDGGWTSW